jgi:hypothetical protein
MLQKFKLQRQNVLFVVTYHEQGMETKTVLIKWTTMDLYHKRIFKALISNFSKFVDRQISCKM